MWPRQELPRNGALFWPSFPERPLCTPWPSHVMECLLTCFWLGRKRNGACWERIWNRKGEKRCWSGSSHAYWILWAHKILVSLFCHWTYISKIGGIWHMAYRLGPALSTFLHPKSPLLASRLTPFPPSSCLCTSQHNSAFSSWHDIGMWCWQGSAHLWTGDSGSWVALLQTCFMDCAGSIKH